MPPPIPQRPVAWHTVGSCGAVLCFLQGPVTERGNAHRMSCLHHFYTERRRHKSVEDLYVFMRSALIRDAYIQVWDVVALTTFGSVQ